jgi:pimeloyl-ACP methyl ester carboxylesterase
MSTTEQLSQARTTSRDGTEIGHFSSGHGPPLLLIHGGVGDHSRWDTLRTHLEPHFTVNAMDRRGRGASGDADTWSIEREYEDVAAVVDAFAAEQGQPVDVYGHSMGGHVAFGAVPLTNNLRRLVLYEAWPMTDPSAIVHPRVFVERLETLLAEGRDEEVVETLFRDAVGATPEELEQVRAEPSWPGRVAAAPTIPREIRATFEHTFDPAQATKVTVPTLLLVGGQAPDRFQPGPVLAALPDARLAELPGQEHEADIVAPELVAEQLVGFLRKEEHR